MKWNPIPEVEGCGMLELEPKQDDRGYFVEMWNKRKIAELGIPLPWGFAQESFSFSHEGVMRGFHLQHHNPQGKLVMCLGGKILDVCLDVRRDSPTFMQMTRVILTPTIHTAFWLPPGTAHAFLALEPSYVHYLCSTPHDADTDAGINAFDPELALAWKGLDIRPALRSDRDTGLPGIHNFLAWRPPVKPA